MAEKIRSGSSRYITPEGFERLREEHEHLWRFERPKVTQQVSDAAAQGDRSENAEYIYGKKRLREIDRRLRFLGQRLEELTVVEPTPDRANDRVYFGSWVELEDEEGEIVHYRLVGPDESVPAEGLISMDSPVGRALMGRSVEDEVEVRRPKGATSYRILQIRSEGTFER
ncbi:MAG: transcription elongation factor GreB [Myxococcota bacterium]|nr:transcription elongation factor GreB [Myxococcota bacterium]